MIVETIVMSIHRFIFLSLFEMSVQVSSSRLYNGENCNFYGSSICSLGMTILWNILKYIPRYILQLQLLIANQWVKSWRTTFSGILQNSFSLHRTIAYHLMILPRFKLRYVNSDKRSYYKINCGSNLLDVLCIKTKLHWGYTDFNKAH